SSWHKSLADGVIPKTTFLPKTLSLQRDVLHSRLDEAASRKGNVAETSKPGAQELYELNLSPDPTIADGRFANNGWLQELPKPLTKLTWENAAMMSPADADRIGVDTGDVIRLTIGQR